MPKPPISQKYLDTVIQLIETARDDAAREQVKRTVRRHFKDAALLRAVSAALARRGIEL